MQKLILLVGIPGSGKSTWANSYVADSNHGCIRVNKDDLRAMLNGGVLYDWRNEVLIDRMQYNIVHEARLGGWNIIIDNIHLSKKHRIKWEDYCKHEGMDFEVKIFDTPLDVCIERDRLRERSLGEKKIREMYTTFVKNWLIEGVER